MSIITGRSLRLGLAAGALLLGAALARPAAAEETVWRQGIVAAKSDAGFVFMASKRGFAAKQGIKIDLVQFKGDAFAMKALLAGELESYEGNPGSPILAATHGADVKIIGCWWPGLTYGLFSKAAVTIETLKGKSFGISSPGSLPDLVARAVLDKYGVPSSEVRFAVLGSDADRYQALLTGVIDVAATSTEFAPLAEKNGLKLLVSARETLPNYLRVCIYTSSKTLATKRDAAAHFLAAQISGLRYALANRAEMIKVTQEVTDSKPDDPRAGYIFDEVTRSAAIVPDMPIPLEKLQWMQDLLVKTGNLDKKIDLNTMIDQGPREAALKLVGK